MPHIAAIKRLDEGLVYQGDAVSLGLEAIPVLRACTVHLHGSFGKILIVSALADSVSDVPIAGI